ncbi:GGDEF domain-containing protein [Longimicrobium sp.]|uniref:GGDEF domain-containing protein n=1 Tax=Longimicrobium sp. TaxID=2029185 RepID=UPI002BFD1D3D|nr:GGDEF domain-containing protein [Longimicrobium sp.]HSU13765.1 GGDEF domain-containing protein [Longimicrobium sp.]
MRLRRGDDRTLGVLMATPTRWIADGTRAPAHDERGPRQAVRAAVEQMIEVPADVQDLVLLLESGPEEGVLLAASGTWRLPCEGEGDLLAQARARIAALRQERMRQLKRQRLPDQLIAYFEELNAAAAEDEVFRALAEHALRIVGAHTSLAFVREPARGMLRAPARPGAAPTEYRACLLWDPRFAEPGLMQALDARAGGPCAVAAPLFGDPATSQVAHVPVADEGVLVLTERREDRVFEPEDWDVMRALALQAEMALRRIRLIESVRSLSLTDSLTGLANRRHMDVVMEHAWASARRGEPLAVMVLDLDGFKAVNDAQGHQAGDRVLCQVADVLRSEARGSDVVVRYGGDEFLAILPGGNAAAAHSLAERVRMRLNGSVGVSAGVAEYRPEIASPDELVRDADRALYEVKRARGCR